MYNKKHNQTVTGNNYLRRNAQISRESYGFNLIYHRAIKINKAYQNVRVKRKI